jgi:hypothetical protein
LIHDGRCVVVDLHDVDDGLVLYYASSWLETYCTILDLLREILSLDDVVSEDEIT